MSQTICIYFFYFVTEGCEKLNFWCRGHEKVILSFGRDHEKVNEARGFQKVIGVRCQDREKVTLYKNC